MSASRMPVCKDCCSPASDTHRASDSRVIINADDFGLSAETNSAIIRFAESGAISSASLMAVGEGFDQAAEWAAANQADFRVGVHLCLSDSVKPLTSAQALVNADGRFRSLHHLVGRALRRTLPMDAIRHEWKTQMDRVRSCGIEPTHLDSHQHVHVLPGISDLVVRMAAEERLAVRHTDGPLGFPISKCGGCIHYWGTYLRPGLWKSVSLRLLGRMLKQRLVSAKVPTIDFYISPSSLCGRMRQGASSRAVVALAELAAGLRGTVEWVVHPSDACGRATEPRWMAGMRAYDSGMLESRLHLEVLSRFGVATGSYADLLTAGYKSEPTEETNIGLGR